MLDAESRRAFSRLDEELVVVLADAIRIVAENEDVGPATAQHIERSLREESFEPEWEGG